MIFYRKGFTKWRGKATRAESVSLHSRCTASSLKHVFVQLIQGSADFFRVFLIEQSAQNLTDNSAAKGKKETLSQLRDEN